MKTVTSAAIRISICALLTVSLCAARLGAQEPTDEPQPGDDAPFQHGPLKLAPTLALKNVGLDSNVFNEVDATAPESDFTATLTPGAQAWLNIGRLRLASRHSVDIVYFQSHPDQRSVGMAHSLKVDLPLTHLTPWVSVGSLSTRDRPGYEIDVRARRVEEALSGGADWNISDRTSVTAGVHRTDTTFEPNEQFGGVWLRQMLDRRVDTLEVAARHKLTPLSTLSLLASRGSERFDLSPIRDGDSLRIGPGLDLDALIHGSIWVGYRRTDFLSPLMPDFSGLVASADVSYTWSAATKVSLGATRDLAYSYEVAQPYYVQTGFSGSVTQHVVSAWDVQARVERQELAYQQLVDGIRGKGTVDRVSMVGFGIGYNLSEEVRIGVNADLYRRRSEAALRDYQRLVVGTSLTYGF